MATPGRIRPKKIPDFVNLVSSEDEGTAGPSRLPLAPKRAVKTPRTAKGVSSAKTKSSRLSIKDVKPVIVLSDDEDAIGDREVKPDVRERPVRPTKTVKATTRACKAVKVGEGTRDPVEHVKQEVAVGFGIATARSVERAEPTQTDVKPSPPTPNRAPPVAQSSARTAYRTPPKHASEDEDDFPTTRTPWRSRRKVVVQSDSEEEAPLRPMVTRDSPLTGMDRLRLWDDTDSEEEAEIEDEGERDYDLNKHYDTSLGSLRDFIVDDSDESESEVHSVKSEEEEEAEMSDGCISSGSSTRIDRRPIVVTDSDDGADSDQGILHLSPTRRPVTLPDFSRLTIDDYPEHSDSDSGSPTAVKPVTKARKIPKTPNSRRIEKDWKVERERIAASIFRELNRKVFEGKLADCTIEWNKRLLTTAGQAKSSRTPQSDGSKKQTVRIVLSEKVLTGEEQILNTVAHEMCHVACWIISNEYKNPHGKIFKSWGRKVMRARPDIEVTTTHSYTIEFKYTWKCSNELCPVVYRRHSKSIDVDKHGCYRCASRLVPQFETKAGNPFQAYLKANMAAAKAATPSASHGEVMRLLSRQWQEELGGSGKGRLAASPAMS